MTTVATVRSELWDLYVRESAAIEQEFSAIGEGHTAVARRTALVDTIVQRLWNEIIVSSNYAEPHGPKNFALVATSDLWDLYVRESAAIEQEFSAIGEGHTAENSCSMA